MEQVNLQKSSFDDQLNMLIKNWKIDYKDVDNYINSHWVDEKLDFLMYLKDNQKTELYEEILINLLCARENWLLDAYLHSLYPWEDITDIEPNFRTRWYIKFNTSSKRLIRMSYKEVSIEKLFEINNQLKRWWSTEKIIGTIAGVNKLIFDITRMKWKLDDNSITNPLIQDSLEKLDKELWELNLLIQQRLLAVIMLEDCE